MTTPIRLATVLLALSTFSAINLSAQDAPAPATEVALKPLKPGDPAPQFKVTQWLKGDPVTLDDKGTYIVECWATWCGPCIAAFPHLSEIAKANKDKIAVIGVNVWERKKPEEVKTFVESQGDKMSYLVAVDGEGAIAKDWLKAAGRTGIPCAFVVSKGKVTWIGHPAGLKQDLLDSILDGTYDLAASIKEGDQLAAAEAYYRKNVMPLLNKNDKAGAIEALEKMKLEFPARAKFINPRIQRIKAQQGK